MADIPYPEILFWTGLVIAGIVVTILRSIRNRSSKMRADALVTQLKDGRINPILMASELYTLVDSAELFNKPTIAYKLRYLLESWKLDKFTVIYTANINPSSFILITLYQDTDFDIKFFGGFGKVNITKQYNFLLKLNTFTGKYDLYSDLPANTTERYQKQRFAMQLFDYLER